MHTYVIAVKREERRNMSLAQAFDLIRDIPGVNLVGDVGPYTVSISAKDRAISAVVRKISKWCHVEASTDHALQYARPV